MIIFKLFLLEIVIFLKRNHKSMDTGKQETN